jgi:hypothetical protein
MKRAFLLTFGVLLAFVPRAIGAPLTLHECITQAIVNSPDMASSRHLIVAAKADITKSEEPSCLI